MFSELISVIYEFYMRRKSFQFSKIAMDFIQFYTILSIPKIGSIFQKMSNSLNWKGFKGIINDFKGFYATFNIRSNFQKVMAIN